MKAVKKIAALVLCAVLLCSLGVTAFASNINYEGAKVFTFDADTGKQLTSSDLFENFKNVMPGDVIEQRVVVQNKNTGSDNVKIYMRAETHNSDEFIEAEIPNTYVEMNDFLHQLTLSVEKVDTGEIIYSGTPDIEDGLSEYIPLCTLASGGEMELLVKLKVPIDLDSKYCWRVGEVDWLFTIEEHDDPHDPTDDPETTVNLIAQKTLNGKAPEGSEYTFILKDEDGQTIDTVMNKGGSIAFKPLKFTKSGTYKYTVYEEKGNRDRVTYDTSVYEVTIRTGYFGTRFGHDITITKDGVEVAGMTFANRYRGGGHDDPTPPHDDPTPTPHDPTPTPHDPGNPSDPGNPGGDVPPAPADNTGVDEPQAEIPAPPAALPIVPQTGLLWWPVLVLAAVGMVMTAYGTHCRRKARDEEN